MGLEQIKKEIEAKASSVSEEILAEAEKKTKEIQKKTLHTVKQLEEEAHRKLKADMDSLKNKESSLASMEMNKLLSQARKEEIAAVYGESEKQIAKLPKQTREKAVKKLIEKSAKQIEVARVYANADDLAFVQGFETQKIQTAGGVICETKDGTIRIDCTFGLLFKHTKETTMPKVSTMLFER